MKQRKSAINVSVIDYYIHNMVIPLKMETFAQCGLTLCFFSHVFA